MNHLIRIKNRKEIKKKKRKDLLDKLEKQLKSNIKKRKIYKNSNKNEKISSKKK